MNELRFEAREESRMSLNITSRVFEDGGGIPGKYTCDTDNISPPLAWSNVPGAADRKIAGRRCSGKEQVWEYRLWGDRVPQAENTAIFPTSMLSMQISASRRG
jgi:hypothetical protein